jgi:NAD(P)H-flavin reductase
MGIHSVTSPASSSRFRSSVGARHRFRWRNHRPGEIIELGVRRAGSLTTALHNFTAGAIIGIRGPFGHPFDLSFLRGQNLLLISGGCGLAPLRSLIQYGEDRPNEFRAITILNGAKNPNFVLFRGCVGTHMSC